MTHSSAIVGTNRGRSHIPPVFALRLKSGGCQPIARDLWPNLVDFERLAQAPIKLFITATNVRTGRGKVFRNNAITPEVLLASACLPTMFQAIEIDGEPYWDGGYSGNPTITPLIRECKSQDTILVPINPIEREGVPRSASEFSSRLNEVSFNAVALKELTHDRSASRRSPTVATARARDGPECVSTSSRTIS